MSRVTPNTAPAFHTQSLQPGAERGRLSDIGTMSGRRGPGSRPPGQRPTRTRQDTARDTRLGQGERTTAAVHSLGSRAGAFLPVRTTDFTVAQRLPTSPAILIAHRISRRTLP
jgi:hypothetical protein